SHRSQHPHLFAGPSTTPHPDAISPTSASKQIREPKRSVCDRRSSRNLSETGTPDRFLCVTGTAGSPVSFVVTRCNAAGRARLHSSDRPRLLLLLCRTVLGSHPMGRALLLWLLGIPIPVIILLYVFHV